MTIWAKSMLIVHYLNQAAPPNPARDAYLKVGERDAIRVWHQKLCLTEVCYSRQKKWHDTTMKTMAITSAWNLHRPWGSASLGIEMGSSDMTTVYTNTTTNTKISTTLTRQWSEEMTLTDLICGKIREGTSSRPGDNGNYCFSRPRLLFEIPRWT